MMTHHQPKPRCAISWRRASTCGFVAIDTETDGLDRDARAVWSACRWPWRRGVPRYVPLRHEGLAEQVPLAGGNRRAAAAC